MAAQQKFLNAIGVSDVSDVCYLFTDEELVSGEAYKIYLSYVNDDGGEAEHYLTGFLELMEKARTRSRRNVNQVVLKEAICVRLEMERRDRERAALETPKRARTTAPPPVPPKPARMRHGTQRVSVKAVTVCPFEAEEAERDKWLRRLLRLLEETEAPSFEGLNRGGSPMTALRLLSGGFLLLRCQATSRDDA